MVYVSIMVLLVLSSIISRYKQELNSKMYIFFMVILTLMLAFRYGQGTDYFAYKTIFDNSATVNDVLFNVKNTHGEIGFRTLCFLFFKQYELFVFCVSLFEMWMLHRFLQKNSVNKLESLTIFFPTYYLVYYYSAMRQGIAMAIFIGILYEYLKNNEDKKYYLGVLLLTSIHFVSIVLIILPLLTKLSIKQLKQLMCGAFVIGIILSKLPIFEMIFQKRASYFTGQISVTALALRACLLIMVLVLYKYRKAGVCESKEDTLQLKIYLIAFVMYGLTVQMPMIASRLMAFFQIVEIVVFPQLWQLWQEKNKYRQATMLALMSILLFMTVKNINSSLYEGSYKEDISIIDYPYVSIFNQEEIWEYRNRDQYSITE